MHSHPYLPRSCVSPEVGKLSRKPVVDFVESQLSFRRLQNGLRTGGDKTQFRGGHGGGDGCRSGRRLT